jgi:hypothetical protein
MLISGETPGLSNNAGHSAGFVTKIETVWLTRAAAGTRQFIPISGAIRH